ncbi:MAG: hypothetical protein WHU54_02275 [Candidatus Bathyarchaeia archaeon]
MSSTPVLGRKGVVKKGETEIGYAKGVGINIDIDLIKEYALNSEKPAFLAIGNQSYKVSIEAMYVDNAYAETVKAGSPVDIELDPAGDVAGNPKITVKNVIFTKWKLDQKPTGVVMQSMEGEGDDLLLETIEEQG